MNPRSVPIKTSKGREEIASRQHGLSARLRRLLVMVDGDTSVGDILRRQTGSDDWMVILNELLSTGFIEAEGEGPSPVTAATKLDGEQQAVLKRFLCEFVHGTLGPMGGDIIMRIQQCDNCEQMDSLIESCRQVVTSVAGKRKADQFMEEVRKITG